MRNIVEVIKSFSNLPKEYKLVLIRAFNTLFEAIVELDELKVDKEEGKGLSENDFTDELKQKLDNIEPGATVQVPSDWEAIEGVQRILNKPNLSVYPDSAQWNKTDKKIYFNHGDTRLDAFTIDGTDFIKDGMIDEVKIENDNLVIVFNTDSGKETISIPLSEIFNPDNYYTKTQIDNLFVKKVIGKDLSSNDFTDELKQKLESLSDGEQSDWEQNDTTKIDYIKNRTHWKEVYNAEVIKYSTPSIYPNFEYIEYKDIDTEIIGNDEFYKNQNAAINIDENLVAHYEGAGWRVYAALDNEDSITLHYNTLEEVFNDIFEKVDGKWVHNKTITTDMGNDYSIIACTKEITVYHKLAKEYIPDDIQNKVFIDVDVLPTTDINKNVIYRINDNGVYKLYHNPSELEDGYVFIGEEAITNEEIDELINE